MWDRPSASIVDNQKVWWSGPPVPGSWVRLVSSVRRTSAQSSGARSYRSARFFARGSGAAMSSVSTIGGGGTHRSEHREREVDEAARYMLRARARACPATPGSQRDDARADRAERQLVPRQATFASLVALTPSRR